MRFLFFKAVSDRLSVTPADDLLVRGEWGTP
jgi:hypothetical protein